MPPAADRDERLAALLDDLTRRQRDGTTPDLDPISRQHPDLADELRQLWAAAQMADALARPPQATATLPGDLQIPPAEPPRTFGDFELVRELGRGGMGVVYEARQRSLNRSVALKMVLRGELASEADRARFRAEAEAAARLVHPNIVQVYEVGDVAGQPYFAMQYVPGRTLARRLTEGPLSPQEAAGLIVAVARAVDRAHQNGIVHRDLKPANVLLTADGTPKVTDFGLAKLIDAAGSL
ncbi:MAG TPA: serine/threonine-protein kinase, partial [Gemmataceae bacterium]|nr:serine/threonine-protein kinase [Gemmataceae bacterium]